MRLVYRLNHLFVPRQSNNQKARLLHNSSFVVVIFVLLIYQFVLHTAPLVGIDILGYAANISTIEVVRLTNDQRLSMGLSQLSINPELEAAARAKGEHMLKYDYWAHIAPDGTEPWKFFADAGYSYKFAGENLARDFSNSTSAVDAWMASPTHRDNLLSSKYSETGIAVVEGDLAGVDTTIIVQLFGSKPGVALQIPEAAQTEAVTVVATLIPTQQPEVKEEIAVPTAEAVATPTTNFVAGVPAEAGVTNQKVLVSPFGTTKGLSVIVIAVLLLVLVVDGLITSKRRISRVGGRTFAHLAYLGMILAIALILRSGSIL